MDIVDIRSKFGKIYVKHKQHGKTVSTTILDHDYYFYSQLLEEKDLKIVKKYSTKVVKHSSNGKEYHKIYCQNDTLNKFDLEKGKLDNKTIIIKYLLGRGVKTYEADFDPWKRFLVDSNHSICSDPTVVYWDLETRDDVDGIEIGRDQILSFAYHVNGKSHFITDKDEYKLLIKLKRLFEKSDLLVGWNSTNFDIPYALARFEKYGIKFWKSELIHIDLMEVIKKKYKYSDQEPITNFNLENISQLFLGKGKIKHSEKIYWLYQNDLKRLEEYNKEDVNLLSELNDKLGVLNLMFDTCRESKTPIRYNWVTEIIDNYVLQESKARGLILPSNMWKLENKSNDSERDQYEGAIVFEPVLGLHENVSVLDFGSMYPNMMITFNIGIDTWIQNPTEDEKKNLIRTPNDCYFRKDIESINSVVAKKLLIERQKAKDEMKKYSKDSIEYKTVLNKSEVIKVLSNSQYGACGSPFTRFYSSQCSEAITISAQYILKFTQKIFTQSGKAIIAGDTDSVFVKGF